MTKPGAQEWYNGLIRHISNMGVDMIKYDDIVPHPDEVEAVAKAIDRLNKPILLSLSPGGHVDPEAINFFRLANMLRVTKDVWDEQFYIDECFKAWRKWQGKEQPGFWIDMDMIPFGQLQLMSPPSSDSSKNVLDKGDIALSGKGVHRICQLTKSQMETFITMRALAASPLMMGGDLPSLDNLSLRLITNPEMLACNQNGVMGSLVFDRFGLETWRVFKKENNKRGWIGVFNRSSNEVDVQLEKVLLGLDHDEYSLFDIWNEKRVFFGSKVQMKPNGVLFIKFREQR